MAFPGRTPEEYYNEIIIAISFDSNDRR